MDGARCVLDIKKKKGIITLHYSLHGRQMDAARCTEGKKQTALNDYKGNTCLIQKQLSREQIDRCSDHGHAREMSLGSRTISDFSATLLFRSLTALKGINLILSRL